MSTDKPESESFASMLSESQRQAPKRANIRVGERLEVVVTKIGKDAVFVELDNKQEGFLERTDLTTKDGELTVKEGSRIVARIAEIGGKHGAVRLAPLVIKGSDTEGTSSTAAPGASAETVMEPGMRVKGAVTRVERYGVFVQIAGTAMRKGRGLVPAQETGAPRGADLHKLFPVGMELETKILAVDEDGKIRLSITALKMDEERGAFEEFAKKDKPKQEGAAKPAPKSFGTFGDLLAKKGISAKK